MPDSRDFAEAFAGLRAILEPYGKKLVVVQDTETNYSLETGKIGPNKKPVFFAAVRQGKSYVSYHLFPVYVKPDLLKEISPDLRRRMQGKSCFNFQTADPNLFRELARLTKEGHAFFKSTGWV